MLKVSITKTIANNVLEINIFIIIEMFDITSSKMRVKMWVDGRKYWRSRKKITVDRRLGYK
jgi:hypothetical protein